MPLQNRVTPFGKIVADPHRGMFTGNRGIIHDPATKTLLRVPCAAATPSNRLAVEMMPSFAPNTAARSHPTWSPRCRSPWPIGILMAPWWGGKYDRARVA